VGTNIKIMILKDYLKEQGLFVKEIILKCKSGQITLNGEKCTENQEVFVDTDLVYSYSGFITALLKRFPENHDILLYYKVEDLHSSNIDNKMMRFINLHTIIKTTKSTGFVLRNVNFYNGVETFTEQIMKCRGQLN